jgi:hypothetical protein
LQAPEQLTGLDADHTAREALSQLAIVADHHHFLASADRLARKIDNPVVCVLFRPEAVMAHDPSAGSCIGVLRALVSVVDDGHLESVRGGEAIQHRLEHAPRFCLLLAGLEILQGRVGEDGVVAVNEPAVLLRVLGP